MWRATQYLDKKEGLYRGGAPRLDVATDGKSLIANAVVDPQTVAMLRLHMLGPAIAKNTHGQHVD